MNFPLQPRCSAMAKQQGFTLLELMMVTAIIGTIASISIPAYQQYSQRARFSEAILAATPYKNAVEVAAFRGAVNNVWEFNSGQHGIPTWQWPGFGGSSDNKFVGVFNGMVFVMWWFDGSPLQGTTYILRAQNHEPPIQWEQDGSCFTQGYC